MRTFFIDKIPRIIKSKKQLEKKLKVKIINKGKQIYVSGKAEDEYVAEKVLDALDFGFALKIAMLIKDEDFELEIIPIKNYTKKTDLRRIRARIIGEGGKTLKTFTELTNCFFEIKYNYVSILGHPEEIEKAYEAIIQLISGSKHANVYKYLEQHRPEPVLDLGLKIKIKK